jgi:hypothetical protein
MTRNLALAAVCAVVLTVTGYAQKKPNFSGTWVSDAAATAVANGVSAPAETKAPPANANSMVIKHTAETLTVERKGPSGPQTFAYPLDGKEHEITVGRLTMKATSKWDGDKLAIEITRPLGDGQTMATTTSIYSLDGAGKLVLEIKQPNGSRFNVYKKEAAPPAK